MARQVFSDEFELHQCVLADDDDQILFVLRQYDGYISPDGDFYGTKPHFMDYYNGSFNSHEAWAEIHLSEVLNVNYWSGSAKDTLVKEHRWISLSLRYLKEHRSGLEMPPGRITVAQAEMLLRYWEMTKLPREILQTALEGRI